MPTTFSEAPATVRQMIEARIQTAHPDMHRFGVRVGATFAYNPTGPGLKHGGYPAAGCIKIVPQKDRIRKNIDAEMFIDETIWEGLYPRQRLALIAHELRHLSLVRRRNRDTGMLIVQTDDNGRPKLKTLPGDWNAGDGFREIVQEFGDDSIEYDNIRRAWANADGARMAGPNEPEKNLFDAAPAADAEPWRAIPFDRLTVAQWVFDAVTAADVKTLGALSDALRSGLQFGLKETDLRDLAEEIEQVKQGNGSAATATSATDSPADAELWQQFPLASWDRFGATPADIEALHRAELKGGRAVVRSGACMPGLHTVGDLAAFSGSGYLMADIKGLGPKALDRLAEAEQQFWKWWNRTGAAEFAAARHTVAGAIADGDDGKPGTRSENPRDGDGDRAGRVIGYPDVHAGPDDAEGEFPEGVLAGDRSGSW